MKNLRDIIFFFVVILNLLCPSYVLSEVEYTRYIAHAGGAIDNNRYTNSLEALDANYAAGFRMFELDLIFTSDSVIVAAHDWDYWKTITSCNEFLVNKEHFMSHPIYGIYTPISIDEINDWFAKHPDAILVTDKINSPSVMKEQFIDPSRLIMELFSIDAINEAKLLGVNYMMSGSVLYEVETDAFSFMVENEVPFFAVSYTYIQNQAGRIVLQKCKEAGIKTYIFGLNSGVDGKDEQYVLDNYMPYIYGMYADKWIDEFSTTTSLEEVSSGNLKVYYNGNLLNIKSESEIRSLTIYDVTGALVTRFNDIYNIEFQALINSNRGLLILQVETTDAVEVFKVF